jgi:hypothetical protein
MFDVDLPNRELVNVVSGEKELSNYMIMSNNDLVSVTFGYHGPSKQVSCIDSSSLAKQDLDHATLIFLNNGVEDKDAVPLQGEEEVLFHDGEIFAMKRR